MSTKIRTAGMTGTLYLEETYDAVANAAYDQGGRLAKAIASKARTNASEFKDSGDLVRGIHHRELKRPTKRGQFAFGNTGGVEKFHAVVSDAEYSAAVEYGTKERFTKAGASRGISPKQGFMWPAADEVAPQYEQSMRDVLRGR